MTDYSRGDYASLPAGKTDLENNYTAPDLTAIASNDNSTYAEQTANNEIAIHQYKKTVTGQFTNIIWSGKSSLAPSESPVILEVYNVDNTDWEELDRDDSTAADTDFDIIYNNLPVADYLDNGVVTWRVYQAATITKYIGEGTVGGEACDYTGIEDNWMNGEQNYGNYGHAVSLLASYTGSNLNRIPLIKIPGLTNIVSATAATLHLYVNTASGDYSSLTFYRVLQPWVSGTITDGYFASTDSPPSSCWTHYVANTNAWNTGGALGATDIAASSSFAVSVTGTGWLAITDAGLLSDIQDMIDTPGENYGWAIHINSGVGNPIIYIDSSESATASLKPYLEVIL